MATVSFRPSQHATQHTRQGGHSPLMRGPCALNARKAKLVRQPWFVMFMVQSSVVGSGWRSGGGDVLVARSTSSGGATCH